MSGSQGRQGSSALGMGLNHRQPRGPFGSDQVSEPGQIDRKHLTVEKQQSGERLVLHRRRSTGLGALTPLWFSLVADSGSAGSGSLGTGFGLWVTLIAARRATFGSFQRFKGATGA